MRSLAVVIALLTTTLLSAQPAPLDSKEIDKVVLATMRAWRIPGLAIAIVRNDRVVHVQGYGSKDLAGTAPVAPDTLFQIASTSKAFTTTAMAMLVGEGKLAWDDPVRKHVEYFRLSDLCADANVTLRDLVSHRTGLGGRDELWDNSTLTREQIIRALASVEPARGFRTGYRYNNIMFMAAGEAVSHAAGMPYEDFVRTRIFQPLQMTSTVISDADWEKSDHAVGHHYDWQTDRISIQKPIETTALGSAGAIKSSARDMANWVRFQLAMGAFDGRQLVDPEALAETKTPQTVMRLENLTRDLNPETNVLTYGMGWYVQDYRGEQLVSHTGSLNGFRTRVELLPKRNAGIVVMINVDRGIALTAIRNALLDRLSGKPPRDWNAYYLMVDRKADEKEERQRLERKARAIPNTQPSRPLDAYAGDYENVPYGTARVTNVNGTLTLQWNRKTLPLTHVQYDVFSAYSEWDDVDETIPFTLGEDGTVKTLTFFGETFVRKPAALPPPGSRQSGR